MTGESLRNVASMTPGAVHKKAYGKQLLHRTTIASALGIFAAVTPSWAAAQEASTSNTPLENKAPGDADLDERAQRHWGSGMAYLEEGDYAKALEAFDKAFQLSGRARILLAIAVTHERRGDLGQAMATLDEYLRLAPDADNAEAIRAHRDELQAQHDEQVQRMNEAKREETTVVGTVDTDTASNTRPDPSVGRDSPPKDASNSDALRWTAFGVGVASGVAATVSGVLAWKKYDELEGSCGATGFCSERQTQPGRTMAWVSTVLTGVAVAGLGVGLWLTLDRPETDTEPHAAQRIYVGLGCRPSGLTSEVSWSF